MSIDEGRAAWRRLRAMQMVPAAALLILFDVSKQIVHKDARADPAPFPIEMLVALGVVSIAMLAIGLPLVRARMFPARARRVRRGAEPSFDAFTAPAGRRALAQLRKGLFVSWALCLAVATHGLIAAMLTHHAVYGVPFFIASMIGLAACLPGYGLAFKILRALPA